MKFRVFRSLKRSRPRRGTVAGLATLAIIAGSVGAGLIVTESAAGAVTATASISAFTQNVTTVNANAAATVKATPVTLSLHLVDPNIVGKSAGDVTVYLNASLRPNTGSYVEPHYNASPYFTNQMTLSSGTPANGTWTTTIIAEAGYAGSYVFDRLEIGEGTDSSGTFQTQILAAGALAAAGAKQIKATVAAAPAAPTGIRSFEALVPTGVDFNPLGFTTVGVFAWTNGGSAPVAVIIDSIAGCPAKGNITPNAINQISVDIPNFGFCTLKWHVFNTQGRSATVSSTGLFF